MIKPIEVNLKELRKSCELVTEEDDIEQIIMDLKDTLTIKPSGLGLSANQIGYFKRIAYIRIPTEVNKKTKEVTYNEYVIINPVIIEKDKKILVQREACLSLPGLYIDTDRYVYITVEYLNEQLEPQTATFQDLESFAVQHECDHLNGRTIIEAKHRRRK
jgi:peptide deformylase